jgi:hypothetical protein
MGSFVIVSLYTILSMCFDHCGGIMKEKYMYISLGNAVCFYTKHSSMLNIHSIAVSKHLEN